MHSATAILPANSPRLTPTLRSMSSASSFASAQSTFSTPFSLNAFLAPGNASITAFSRPHTRANSISSSAATSTVCSYSKEELERERELFGESAMGVFEPRDQLGWWGVGEVLSMENL